MAASVASIAAYSHETIIHVSQLPEGEFADPGFHRRIIGSDAWRNERVQTTAYDESPNDEPSGPCLCHDVCHSDF